MRIVEFNGLGVPRVEGVGTGSVLLLWQDGAISVVRLEILPPEDFGPCLERADNSAELEAEARAALAEGFPKGFSTDRHWTIECPQHIAQRARFPSKAGSPP
jgi:hypothetical protein